MITGIMGALPQEIDIIKEQIKNISEVEHGSRKYYKGEINNMSVVLVFSRWGKVAASATVTSLITEFKIDQLVFTGVAGAVSSELNVGDIVISSNLYQHDMDPRPLFPRHEIPLTAKTFFEADINLINKAKDAFITFCNNPVEKIAPEVLKKFNITTPKCVIGTIATGDQFIADPSKTRIIREEKPQTLAVEMEGAAVAQVCHEYNIPFVVVRTISDRADDSAHIDFPLFIEDIAKHYSENIVRHMFAL